MVIVTHCGTVFVHITKIFVSKNFAVKVNGYTFGQATLPFLFPSQWGSTLKGKNLLLQEQILSFKNRPHSGKLHHHGKQIKSHKSYFPLKIMRKKNNNKTKKMNKYINSP